MKRLTAWILVLTLVLALCTGCGKENTPDPTDPPQPSVPETPVDTPSEAPAKDTYLGDTQLGQFTIVYDGDSLDYTQRAAEYIANQVLARTGIILPEGLKQIGEGAFAGCDDLETVNFTGSQEAWDQIQIGDNNQPLLDAALHTDYKVVGDFDGNMKVDYDDVLYLLWHTLFEEDFPIKGRADFDDSGAVTYDDVLYLLWHTLYPEDFPLITETT